MEEHKNAFLLAAQDIAEAIFRIASFVSPKSHYYVSAPGETIAGLTIPEILQVAHCEPIDDAIELTAGVILSGVPPIPVPCTPALVLVCGP